MANATPQSGSCPLAEENHSVLLQQLFMLACIHPLYMNTWAAFVSLALYQVTRHGYAVCLMEMLCRKRPCVLNICTSVMGYSWVRLSVTICLISLSSCDCKQLVSSVRWRRFLRPVSWLNTVYVIVPPAPGKEHDACALQSHSPSWCKCFAGMKYRTYIYYLLAEAARGHTQSVDHRSLYETS